MSRLRWGVVLLVVAVILVAVFLWSRVHILLIVPIPLGGFLLLLAGLILLVYGLLRLVLRR